MSKPKHTPGPWETRVGFDDETVEVFAPNPEIKPPFKPTELAVVRLPYGDDFDEDERERDANARLIAAAPQMLEALEKLLKLGDFPYHGDEDGCVICEVVTEARAAIAAATGEGKR